MAIKKLVQKKNIWTVFSVFAVASIAFLLIAPHAKAVDVATVLSPQKAMYSGIAWVVDLIFKLLAQIVALAGALVDFALGLDAFANAEGVKIGWRILRDFSNMAFVVILLVMAFATIFGQETWGMKKLLPKLIAAALLINFSLAIAGFIIDISQYFSAFFLKAGVSGGGVSATLAHGLSISRLVQAAPDTSWSETLNSGLSAIIYGSVLGGAVLLVAAFVFGVLAFMLFARMFVLWTLLIVSPVVWVLWILPVTKKYFHDWWTAFLHWTFFAPIYCFFLYIALRIIDSDIIKSTFQANVRQMQSSTSAMDFASEFSGHELEAVPVVLIETVLDGNNRILADETGIVVDHTFTGQLPSALAFEHIKVLFLVKERACRRVERDHDIIAGLVTGFAYRFDDDHEGFLVRFEVGCETALVADRSVVTLFLEH